MWQDIWQTRMFWGALIVLATCLSCLVIKFKRNFGFVDLSSWRDLRHFSGWAKLSTKNKFLVAMKLPIQG